MDRRKSCKGESTAPVTFNVNFVKADNSERVKKYDGLTLELEAGAVKQITGSRDDE